MLVPVDLAVDSNRDGVIKFAGNSNNQSVADKPFDTTSQDKPFRFWVNDDDDSGDVENTGSTWKDSYSDSITSKRDLEDFTRLWINVGGLQEAISAGTLKIGLKWKNSSNFTPPTIKIFQAAESDGGTKYITDNGTATAQIGGDYKKCKATISGTTSVALPTSIFKDLTADHSICYLLFEGAEDGKAELQVTILDQGGKEIGAGPSIWLDIMNIKKMYARGKGTPCDPSGLPNAFSNPSTSYDDSGVSWSDDTSGNQFSKPWDEEKKIIVFVHGSNEPYLYSVANAQTMFKRLWWQGYKGRFAFFRWDTLVGPLDGFLPAQYNVNEWRAWAFGNGLKSYVENIPDTDGYTRNICGHSLGNTVIASALRKGMQVTNCVLMQGAIPAGCFDPSGSASQPSSTNGYQKFWDAEVNHHTPDSASDYGYRGYLNGVSGTLVNFYNESDFALATGFLGYSSLSWEGNQNDYKPDAALPAWCYSYDSSLNPGFQIKLYTTNYAYRRFVTDPHESMSFVARARSKALGARASVGGVIRTNINVGQGDSSVGNLSEARSDHSGEFTRSTQVLQGYYKELIKRLGGSTLE